MKKVVKNFGLSIVAILLAGFSAHAGTVSTATSLKNNAYVSLVIAKDNLVGGWSYTVEGAPSKYEKGLLVIVKDGDSYKVQLQVGDGTLMGENVKVKGNTIDFEVMVEGERVSVNLTAKGDQISGSSTSSEGSYSINGEKTLSME